MNRKMIRYANFLLGYQSIFSDDIICKELLKSNENPIRNTSFEELQGAY